jgi:hypothetical protein
MQSNGPLHQVAFDGWKMMGGSKEEKNHGMHIRVSKDEQHPGGFNFGDKCATALCAYFGVFDDLQYSCDLWTQYTTQTVF